VSKVPRHPIATRKLYALQYFILFYCVIFYEQKYASCNSDHASKNIIHLLWILIYELVVRKNHKIPPSVAPLSQHYLHSDIFQSKRDKNTVTSQHLYGAVVCSVRKKKCIELHQSHEYRINKADMNAQTSHA